MTTYAIGANYPTGRDYASVSDAWTALPSTLAADYIFELYNDAEFTDRWVLDGKTMAGHTVTIRPAAGEGFKDNIGTGPVRYDQANGVGVAANDTSGGGAWACWYINVPGITIEGIQFRNTANATSPGGLIYLDAPTAGTCVVRDCIIASPANSIYNGYTDQASSLIVNCLLYATAYYRGLILQGNYNTGLDNSRASSCTILATGTPTGSSYGIYAHGNTATVIDCAIFGATAAMDVSTGTGGNNAGDDATSTNYIGSNNVTGLTASAQFTSVTGGSEDFRPLNASPGIANSGAADSSNTGDFDMLGAARSASTPTIGAVEIGGGVTTTNYYLGSDITAGNWTTSTGSGTLTSMVDETTRDDTDYIQSEQNPSADLVSLEWANVQVPNVNTDHTVSYVLKGDASCQALVGLLAGDATTVTAWVHTALPPTFTRFDRNLSTAAADAWSVGGYAGSRLTVTAG